MNNNNGGLWGEEFVIPSNETKTKKILDKINKPKEVTVTVEKQLKSKKLSLKERLTLITENVLKILGKHKEDTIVITTKEEFHSYIDKAIENGILAFDTETNNTLDYLNCKLMGPCIYTPGLKQAYIPLNHVDPDTNIRLSNQLNEQDVIYELKRLIAANVKLIMHNGKFDYQVVHCTCGVDLPIYWDTYVAARLLDENEPSAGLKQQYIDKIDSTQQKYDIEHLFENVEYAQVAPHIFALYAATDALMTYELYLWQKAKFENTPDLSKIYSLFLNTEMPLIPVIAKMELRGISLDFEYANRLNEKYQKLIVDCDNRLMAELNKLQPAISKWKLTPEANKKQLKRNGDEGGKSKLEQLSDPISLDSPTQLAILLYDILKVPQVSKTSPRGTGVNELPLIAEKTKLPLCDLILEKRGLAKLLNTFIEKLPGDVNSFDKKIHCSFMSVATDTGRFSSKDPNLQNIPARNKEIRSMFCAEKGGITEVKFDNLIKLDYYDEIETTDGWVKAKNLTPNHILTNNIKILKVEHNAFVEVYTMVMGN